MNGEQQREELLAGLRAEHNARVLAIQQAAAATEPPTLAMGPEGVATALADEASAARVRAVFAALAANEAFALPDDMDEASFVATLMLPTASASPALVVQQMLLLGDDSAAYAVWRALLAALGHAGRARVLDAPVFHGASLYAVVAAMGWNFVALAFAEAGAAPGSPRDEMSAVKLGGDVVARVQDALLSPGGPAHAI